MSSESATDTSQPLYRVSIKDCGSTYARRLYDVDGFVLQDDEGNFINVYSKEMRNMIDQGRIRAIRSLRNNYLYFITYDAQRRRFKEEREIGSKHQRVTYYVYRDKEDVYSLPMSMRQ